MAGAALAARIPTPATYIERDATPLIASPMVIKFEHSASPTADPSESAETDSFQSGKKFWIGKDAELSIEKGSIQLRYNGNYLMIDENDQIISVFDPLTGEGTTIGSMDWANGIVTINDETSGSGVELEVLGGLVFPNLERVGLMVGRTPGAPILVGQFTVSALPYGGGDLYTASADSQGVISGDECEGYIDYNSGCFIVRFGEWVPDDASAQSELWYDASDNDGSGNVWHPFFITPDEVTFNCVVTSYLPLDADLLGLNPVRLPIDGKVPIFKDGNILLVHHSVQTTCPSPLSADQVIELPRDNLSLIELYDANGLYVPEAGNYTVDLAAGEITMANPLDLAAYTQPLVALHRIEDLCLASDVQVTGHISITSPLQNSYSASETLVSSVLPAGDLQARVYNVFFQDDWYSNWTNTQEGDAPISRYDIVNYPFILKNKNAIQERFACIFTSSTTIQLVGEHLGVIFTGSITSDIAPINPQTGEPYFTIQNEGWGSGWSTGDVFRFNLAGAGFPYWFCRTTLQGPATENSDKYVVQLRGDSA